MVTRKHVDGGSSRAVSTVRPARPVPTSRDNLSGGDWLLLGAGVAAWAFTRVHPSGVVRTAGLLAGTALVGHAASGHRGLRRLLGWTPLGARIR